MCSVNHELKAIYMHIPKVGGNTVKNILEKFYEFKTMYFINPDHLDYCIHENEKIGRHKIKMDKIHEYYDLRNFYFDVYGKYVCDIPLEDLILNEY